MTKKWKEERGKLICWSCSRSYADCEIKKIISTSAALFLFSEHWLCDSRVWLCALHISRETQSHLFYLSQLEFRPGTNALISSESKFTNVKGLLIPARLITTTRIKGRLF